MKFLNKESQIRSRESEGNRESTVTDAQSSLGLWLAPFLIGASLVAADPAVIEKGRAEEKRSCTSCHSMRMNAAQRLTRAQWDRELTKMAGWGAIINDRNALLEYLAANYGDNIPPAPLARTENGAGRK